ncbi:hypothetical protein BHE74_00036681 [Ensete ventricosum]|nr:hypothetical protein BHE74_00036681 [Ensete ventricosum]
MRKVFKILSIPNVLALGKSYEEGFVKKCVGHKLCAKSSFDRFFFCIVSEFQNIGHSQRISHEKVEFRSVFRAPSQNFKILAIPNVLDHGKSYEHGFKKKCDGHKLCPKSRVESCFDRFFMYRLGISKYSFFCK